MTNGIEHIFICLWAIYTPFFVRCLLRSCAHFLSVVFLLLSCRRSSEVPDKSALYNMLSDYLLQVDSVLTIHLLPRILTEYNSSNFSFLAGVFCILRDLYLLSGLGRKATASFIGSIVITPTFKSGIHHELILVCV